MRLISAIRRKRRFHTLDPREGSRMGWGMMGMDSKSSSRQASIVYFISRTVSHSLCK